MALNTITITLPQSPPHPLSPQKNIYQEKWSGIYITSTISSTFEVKK